jgi:glycosyltransferase involved in cell wall biosynthesis
VREAIDSALRETDVEVIVVDDASTDDTWDTLGSYGARIRRQQLPCNSGQSVARNAGITLARGRYLKFLDSDDLLVEGHLRIEVAAASESGADLVVSGWTGENGLQYAAPDMSGGIDAVLRGLAVPTSSALYLSSSLEARWNPELRKLDDWDFFCQAALRARSIVSVPGSAYQMRGVAGQRATTVATMLVNAREHHLILHRIEHFLEEHGALSAPRRQRLAQYYYKELRVLCLHDRQAFEEAVRHIVTLDPRFVPRDEERQWWMRILGRILGARRAVLLHTFAKRLLVRHS